MALADMDGFLDAITDTEMLKETALAAAGGMIGAVGYEAAKAKIKFLREGEGNVPMLKQVATRLGMSVIFAALLGESQDALAKGYVGGTMGGLGVELLNKFAPEALAPTTLAGYYPLAETFSSQVELHQLQGLNATRAYSGDDIPAGVGGLSRVSVQTPDPVTLASLHSGGY